MRWGKELDRLLLVFGLLLLGIYGVARLHQVILTHASMQAFRDQQEDSSGTREPAGPGTAKPDFNLWSPKRIKGYEDSLDSHFAPAVGILRIPTVGIEVPILEGTDELTLNRGVGHITGTAKVGQDGNVGIAGHRDGFFRGLKDMKRGDTIELVVADRSETYVVDNIVVVDPSDIAVLESRDRSSVTLVTCYPFYFVGSAPKRYIVQASIQNSAPAPQRISSPLKADISPARK